MRFVSMRALTIWSLVPAIAAAAGCNAVLGLEDPVQAEATSSASSSGTGGAAATSGAGGSGGSDCPSDSLVQGNILPNSSFEADTTGWTLGTPDALLKRNSKSHCGCSGVEFSGSNSATYKAMSSSIHVKLLPNATFTAQAFAYKPPNDVGSAPQLMLGYYDAATKKVVSAPVGFFNESVGDGWFRATTQLTVGITTADVLRVDVVGPTNKSFSYALDCITLAAP